jgi:membrane protease YdiL (CAAX protease family)
MAATSSIRHSTAASLVILFWLGYTTLQTLFVAGRITEAVMSVFGFIPGLAGIAILTTAGFSKEQLYLRIAPLSWKGFAILAGIFIFGLAVVLPFGEWQGWNWLAALVYAPASGISQELFFRSVLFPTFLGLLKQRPALALGLHSVLFGLWHIGPLFIGAPLWAVFAVMFVPLVCGIGWGWQVQHDNTVVWAMLQHTLIWVIGGQFPIPG